MPRVGGKGVGDEGGEEGVVVAEGGGDVLEVVG